MSYSFVDILFHLMYLYFICCTLVSFARDIECGASISASSLALLDSTSSYAYYNGDYMSVPKHKEHAVGGVQRQYASLSEARTQRSRVSTSSSSAAEMQHHGHRGHARGHDLGHVEYHLSADADQSFRSASAFAPASASRNMSPSGRGAMQYSDVYLSTLQRHPDSRRSVYAFGSTTASDRNIAETAQNDSHLWMAEPDYAHKSNPYRHVVSSGYGKR